MLSTCIHSVLVLKLNPLLLFFLLCGNGTTTNHSPICMMIVSDISFIPPLFLSFLFRNLTELSEVFNVAAEGFSGRVDVVVGDAELFASLFDDGCDLGVVRLDYAREEVMSCLVVQGTGEYGPEPTSSGVVLRCCHLHLGPWKT